MPTKTVALCLLVVASASCDSLRSRAPASDEETLLRLEERWVDALVRDDEVALDALLAPDFTFIEPDGTVKDRAAYLADRGHNEMDTQSMRNDELTVKLAGDFAVVGGVATISEIIEGRSYSYRLRWKELWSRSAGTWRVVTSQATPVNPDWLVRFATP